MTLQKIESEEQYERYSNDLKYFEDEYNWLTNSKEPLKEIRNQFEKEMSEIEKDKEEADNPERLSRIYALKVKYIMVKENTYEERLKKNIAAIVVRNSQYEAKQKHIPLSQVILGVMSLDSEKRTEALLYLKNCFDPDVNAQDTLDYCDTRIDSSEAISRDVITRNNLVGIVSDKALVPVKDSNKEVARTVSTSDYRDTLGNEIAEAYLNRIKNAEPKQITDDRWSTLQRNDEKSKAEEEVSL